MHKGASLPIIFLAALATIAAPASYAWLNLADAGVITVKDTRR